MSREISQKESELDHAAFTRTLSYSKDTGLFTWNINSGLAKKGDVAGWLYARRGYWNVSFKGVAYLAHRAAWFHVHGVWPNCIIDHINGIKTDNRICNLRDVPFHINTQNQPVRNNNVAKLQGAYFQELGPTGRPWRSMIRCHNKIIFLGRFKTGEEAHQAYIKARDKYHAPAIFSTTGEQHE